MEGFAYITADGTAEAVSARQNDLAKTKQRGRGGGGGEGEGEGAEMNPSQFRLNFPVPVPDFFPPRRVLFSSRALAAGNAALSDVTGR